MTKFFAIFAICFLLSGCSSGSTPLAPPTPPMPPVPVPPPAAIVPERRGRRIWAADWSGPDIGAAKAFREFVPPVLLGDAPWLVSNGPGSEGWWAAEPAPNEAYDASGGIINLRALIPGWSMITSRTFSRDAYCSIGWAAKARLTSPAIDAFFSIGFYDGEMDYCTLNFMRATTPGKLALVLLTEPAHSLDILVDDFCAEGEWHIFRLDMEDGVFSAYVDDRPLPLPNYGPLLNDPHVSVFIGGMAASIGRLDVFSEA